MSFEASVFQLVLHNFLALNIRQAVLFNCWPLKNSVVYHRIASAKNCYFRFVHLDRLDDFADFEVNFLARASPTLGVFFDLNCRNSARAFITANRDGLFVAHNHWLAFERADNLSSLTENFQMYGRLSVDADFTYAHTTSPLRDADTSAFTLYDVYSNGQHIGGAVNITVDREILCTASECMLARYLSRLHERTKYNNRNRMADVTMRVATIATKRNISLPEREIFEFLMSVNNTRIDNIARFGFQRLMIFKDMLQCNMSHWITDRWSTTEVFGGVVGALANNTVDIGSTPFFITAVRLQHLRPTITAGSYKDIIMFRTPRDTVIQGGVFLKPFNSAVWFVFAGILVLAAVFLWLTFKIECRRRRCEYLRSMPSLLATFLVAFGAACVQGSHLIPHSTAGRLAFASLSFFSFIMYNYYTSIVVSTLLGSPVTTNIRTLADLADSPLEVAFERKRYIEVFLNTSTSVYVRRLVDRKIRAIKDQSKVWMTQEVGIPRVRDQPGFVYVMEALPGYILVGSLFNSKQICDLNEIEIRPDNRLHSHLNRNSTYIELSRLRDLRVAETGVYKKHFNQWVPSKFSCFDRNYIYDVGLEYTAPLFFLLFVVYGLVLFVLVVERLAYNTAKQSEASEQAN